MPHLLFVHDFSSIATDADLSSRLSRKFHPLFTPRLISWPSVHTLPTYDSVCPCHEQGALSAYCSKLRTVVLLYISLRPPTFAQKTHYARRFLLVRQSSPSPERGKKLTFRAREFGVRRAKGKDVDGGKVR